jgi:hypothetical protein
MVTVKKGRSEAVVSNRKLQNILTAFLQTKDMMDRQTKSLNDLKGELIEVAQDELKDDLAQTVTFKLESGEGVKVNIAKEIVIEDAEALAKILGANFDVYVKTTHKAKTGLKTYYDASSEVQEYCSLREKAPAVSVIR